MPDFTTTALLSNIRRRGSVPNSSAAGAADSDLLAIATDCLTGPLAALIRSAKEDFFAATYSASTVADTASYPISPRAQALGLQEVELVDSAGEVSDLERISRAQRSLYDTSTSRPTAFYFEDGKIVLTPTPDGVYTLRLPYFRRPSALVATSACAVITAISSGTKVLTLSATIPSTFTTTATYDLVSAKSGFEPRGIDLAVSAASGTSMTFSATLPTDLVVGDYVCLAQESCVAQVPWEFHQVLAQMAAIEWLDGPGRNPGRAQAARQKLEPLKAEVLSLALPRVEGEPEVVAQTAFFNGGE